MTSKIMILLDLDNAMMNTPRYDMRMCSEVTDENGKLSNGFFRMSAVCISKLGVAPHLGKHISKPVSLTLNTVPTPYSGVSHGDIQKCQCQIAKGSGFLVFALVSWNI